MRKFLMILFLLGSAFAQQEATLSGIIKLDGETPEGVRVAIHLVDRDNAWQREIASVTPVAGTFSISTSTASTEELLDFKSGTVLFPDLINEYEVSPTDAKYVRGIVDIYLDYNSNGVFDNSAVDKAMIGIASLENPVGFFTLIYVDKDVSVSGKGTQLDFKQGWNIYTVRYPDSGTIYNVEPVVNDLVLDIFF